MGPPRYSLFAACGFAPSAGDSARSRKRQVSLVPKLCLGTRQKSLLCESSCNPTTNAPGPTLQGVIPTAVKRFPIWGEAPANRLGERNLLDAKPTPTTRVAKTPEHPSLNLQQVFVPLKQGPEASTATAQAPWWFLPDSAPGDQRIPVFGQLLAGLAIRSLTQPGQSLLNDAWQFLDLSHEPTAWAPANAHGTEEPPPVRKIVKGNGTIVDALQAATAITLEVDAHSAPSSND